MGLMRLAQQDRDTVVATYRALIPDRAFEVPIRMGLIQDDTSIAAEGNSYRILTEPSHEVRIRVPAQRTAGDFALSLDLEEAGAGQLRLSFVVINDLSGPRFNIDIDAEGHLTLLGTASRNYSAEAAALRAGLGPCQVRRGLKMFATMLPKIEAFAQAQGYVAIVLEPLTYHNAVMYERYGFGYVRGRKRMAAINREFRPGGILRAAMDDSTQFRRPELCDDPRGRSWAIHDGILDKLDGDPHLDHEMVKVIGSHANQITFNV